LIIYQFIAQYKQLQNKSTSAFIMAYIYYDKDISKVFKKLLQK